MRLCPFRSLTLFATTSSTAAHTAPAAASDALKVWRLMAVSRSRDPTQEGESGIASHA